ncbi:single-stranded DNA-binding protein [Microbacter sp. GSS18]|nr:single-stranded DNA-binding protein [Microbacter sp. GSS18]
MTTEMITFTGRIGTTPTQRVIAGGITVTTFRVGCSRGKRDAQTGQWSDDGTSWYTVSAYRRLGEFAAASLRTGEPVLVTGRLKIRQWENASAKGIAVDVDADAIGHDLNWGTSAFVKPDRADASTGARESERQPPPAPDDQQWARPGEDTPPADTWATAGIPTPDGERSGGAASMTEAPF